MVTTRHVMTLAGVLAVSGLVAAAGYAVGERKAVELPPAAAAAVGKVLPGAETRQVKLEKESIPLYEVKAVKDGAEIKVEVAPDGTIMQIQKGVARGDLPAAVSAALARAAGGAGIKELERSEIHAQLKFVKLDKPMVVFEAEFVKDGKTVEVKIDENGKVVSQQSDDGDDNDNDNDNDQKVGIGQVPAAVKAAILKEAGTRSIKEIDVETKDGRTVYEAKWVVSGKELELKVAADGTILSKDDDNGDNGDDGDDGDDND